MKSRIGRVVATLAIATAMLGVGGVANAAPASAAAPAKIWCWRPQNNPNCSNVYYTVPTKAVHKVRSK